MLLGLLLAFWSPLGFLLGDITVGILTFFWRGMTVLFIWVVLLLLFIISSKGKMLIAESFCALSKWIKLLIIVFFIIGVLSASIKAFSPPTAFKALAIDLSMLLCVLYLASYFKRYPKAINWLIATVIICAILYFLITVGYLYAVDYLLHAPMNKSEYLSFILNQLNFSNKRFLDHFISWFLPLLALPLMSSNYVKLMKVLSFIAMVALWFFVIAHASRSILVEYVVILLVMSVLNYRMTLRFFFYHLSAAVIAALLFIIVNSSVGLLSVLERDVLANGDRWLLWARTLNIAIHNPLLGVGELNLVFYLQDYPHNIVLAIFAQWGVVALAAFLLVVLRSFIRAVQLMREYIQSELYFVAFSSVLAGMIHALFSNLFRMPLSQISLIFALGLLLSFMRTKSVSLRIVPLICMNVFFVILMAVFIILPMYYVTAM